MTVYLPIITVRIRRAIELRDCSDVQFNRTHELIVRLFKYNFIVQKTRTLSNIQNYSESGQKKKLSLPGKRQIR
jgi:hypothetical protein